MAMIKCSECGKDISDKAAACIGCGAPIMAATEEPTKMHIDSSEPSKFRSLLKSGGDAMGRASAAARNIGGKVATQIGDLNGDGKIDEEDFKIAATKAKQIASGAADETAKLGKEVLRSDFVKDVVAGAAVGAVVAIPVPIVGPAAGAIVGAGLGVYKNITK